jgi:hypothetical protein
VSGKSRMKKPRRLVLGVYLDDELVDRFDLVNAARDRVRLELERTRPRRLAEYAAAGVPVEEAFARVQGEDEDGLAELDGDVAAAQSALDDGTEWFVFEAIGHRRLQAMIRAHPPTEEQTAAATARGQEADWNEGTFLRALTEDSCVSHKGDVWDDVFGTDEISDTDDLPARSAWSKSDVEVLVATAMAANQHLRTADRGRAPSLSVLLRDT